MSFEIKYFYHPKKDGGGYDLEKTEEKSIKVGKAFEDISLEKLAAIIMAQMARRDILVTNVEIYEFVKKKISFKECKDGKGITIKGRKFSFNESSGQFVSEGEEENDDDFVEEPEKPSNLDHLYQNLNKPLVVKKLNNVGAVDQSKILYSVYFDPTIPLISETKRLGLKFTKEKLYHVHKIIEDPSGDLSKQLIVVTDDTGKAVKVDEKYFTAKGGDLLWDNELKFSEESRDRGSKTPKLSFEDEMFDDSVIGKNNGNVYEKKGIIPDIIRRK